MTAPSRLAIASTDPRVQAAWREYVEAVDRGETIEVERFLAGHPAAAEELRSLIAFDEEARRLMGGASPKGDLALAQTIPPKVPKAEVSTHSVAGKVVETSAVKPPIPAVAPQGKAVEASMARRGVVATPPKPPLPKSPNDLPDSFGRYQVKQKLGEGAMGAVYLAVDSLLQRKVALKTPTFEDDTDGELLKRFHREARAVANLKHPNLCAVYDVGEIDGRHYISMEFVPGKKLQEFIKADKPMTEKQAMAVVRKIALGMHEAHAHGVIHRDLKPDNIMVNEKGEPVVMDFGLVHKTDQQNSTKITQRGTLIGSPAYMSKEQVEGDPDKLTGATDQYSLGVILYQLLTSKLPFEGGIHAVLGAILTREPPPPSEHRPDLNPHLEAVCLKMMAKEAQNRYPSMKAAADALAAVARGTSTTAGASLIARPKGGASDAALETTLEPAASREGADEFDFNAPNEPPRHRKSSRRGPFLPPNSKRIGGVAAAFVLLAAVIWIVFSDQRVKVEILADGYEVKFNEAEITITDGTRETKVKPGEHTLHVKSSKPGDDGTVDGFDTERLTLKKGGKPVVIVTREGSETVVKLDGVPVPRKSFTKSATGTDNSALTNVPPANKPTFDEWDLAKPLGKSQWSPLDNGELHGSGAGWLATKQDYTDFELSLEYELPSGGNSGVFVRASPTGNPNGAEFIELQLLDENVPAHSSLASNLQTGSLWKIAARKQALNTTPNQWHSLVVRAVGQRIQVTHDGIEALDTYLNSVTIPSVIKRQPSGRIGLQTMDTAGARFRNITIRDLTKAAAKIPADAKSFGNHSYKFYEEKLTWKDAKAKCESLGGNLVIIDSAEENKFVADLIVKAFWQESWIGITDEAREGKWLTVTGQSQIFMNWFTNQPNNKESQEHFALMSNRKAGGKDMEWRWSDQPNQALSLFQPGFVCEWNSTPATRSQPGTTTQPSTVASPAKNEEWITLFNGKNLDGWAECHTNHLPWGVADKVIMAPLKPGTIFWLYTKKEFEEFDLEVEYRTAHGADSGVAFFGMPNSRSGEWGQLGLEVQFDGSLYYEHLKNYPEAPRFIAGAYRANEWNQLSMSYSHSRGLIVHLNGSLTTKVSPELIEAVRKSGALKATGSIALQAMHGKCEFRNIRVRRLNASELKLKENASSTASAKKTGWHSWPADAPPPAITPFDAEQAKQHQEAWAKYLKVPVEYTNTIGMKFRLIPPGEFLMGTTADEIKAAIAEISTNDESWNECIRRESPEHKAVLTQPFYLGVCEVTQEAYESIVGRNPSYFSTTGDGSKVVAGLDTRRFPVETVSWKDATAFCNILSQRESRKRSETTSSRNSSGYCLPTEAQWEFACRAGTTTRFWTGDTSIGLAKIGWWGHAGLHPHAVSELQANPFGLTDMHGNVWEWIQDGWSSYDQFANKPKIDWMGPDDVNSRRGIRGGYWYGAAASCRSSGRNAIGPQGYNAVIGFRVSLPVDAVKAAIAE